MVLSQVFLNYRIIGISELSDKFWKTKVTLSLIIQHLYFLGNIQSNSFNGVIWSLIHELRISIIFPFFIIFVKKHNLKVNLLLCFSFIIFSSLNDIFHIQVPKGYLITYFDSLNYLSVFILGGLLAKHKDSIILFFNKLTLRNKILLLIISLFAYNLTGIITNSLYQITKQTLFSVFYLKILTFGNGIGAVGFLIIALSSKKIIKILMMKPLVFLGKISYSVYLFHLPIILSSIYIFYGSYLCGVY
jgi:peptidoglycan/LPS O-acetylase OafA/YrhL